MTDLPEIDEGEFSKSQGQEFVIKFFMVFDFEFEFGEDEGPFLHTEDSLEE